MSDPQDDASGAGGGSDPQPQSGQQPAGQAPQQAYRTGPGVGDIFSIPETVNELKIGVALNVLVSIGFAFVALGLTMQSTGMGGGMGGFFGGSIAMLGPLVLAPLVGVVIGLRQADVLEDQPDNVLYATALVTTLVGTFLLMLISMILGLVIAGASNLGQILGRAILPFIVAAIGAGLVAAGAVWVDKNVLPGPSRAAGAPPGQSQPP